MVPSPKQTRIEQKLFDGAREHLQGELPLATFRGQTVVSPILLPLIGPLLVIAKPRVVIVTDRSIVTLQQSRWSESTTRDLVSRHERGTVAVTVSRWGLRIGEDPTIFASATTLDAMRAVAELTAADPA
jgi:hypothetical protein